MGFGGLSWINDFYESREPSVTRHYRKPGNAPEGGGSKELPTTIEDKSL